MKIAYTTGALDDLDGLSAFLNPRHAGASRRVRADISSAIDTIRDHPLSGRALDDGAVRKSVTRQFGYVILYEAIEATRTIYVLGIYHPAREWQASERLRP